MYQLVLLVHVLVSLVIIGLVLMQQGKGSDMGSAFGSGASGTVFGSQGTGSFLFKLTASLVFVFFVTSLLLSSIVARQQSNVNLDVTAPVSGRPLPVDSE